LTMRHLYVLHSGSFSSSTVEQNRTELYYHKKKYLWQAARIANMLAAHI